MRFQEAFNTTARGLSLGFFAAKTPVFKAAKSAPPGALQNGVQTGTGIGAEIRAEIVADIGVAQRPVIGLGAWFRFRI